MEAAKAFEEAHKKGHKVKQNKDLFLSISLAKTPIERVK
jgi:hypothetical protein